MESVRSFLYVWFCFALAIVVYAFVDLQLNPSLHVEGTLTLEPDFARIGDLAHWGGRLLRANGHMLVVGNAVIFGGMFAFLTSSLVRLFSRPRRRARAAAELVESEPARASIY